MGRFLGIDYGEKRIGLAFGDELGLAYPIEPATQRDEAGRLQAIASVAARRRVDAIVVGYPYNMNGSVGFKAREVDEFIKQLEAVVDLPIHRMDERLTTRAVQQGMEETGRKGKRDRKVRASGEIDSRAAALILQDYLDANGLSASALPTPLEDDVFDED